MQQALHDAPAFLIDGRPVTVSCSVAGVRNHAELGEATRRADRALYGARDAGRNQIRVAD